MKPLTGTLESCDGLNGRQFAIAVRRLADSLQYGTDASPFVGSGIEYAQSRPYEAGDPGWAREGVRSRRARWGLAAAAGGATGSAKVDLSVVCSSASSDGSAGGGRGSRLGRLLRGGGWCACCWLVASPSSSSSAWHQVSK